MTTFTDIKLSKERRKSLLFGYFCKEKEFILFEILSTIFFLKRFRLLVENFHCETIVLAHHGMPSGCTTQGVS